MPFVYILRCADDTLYTGWALDVQARLRQHNLGRGARYTRTRRPVELIYAEPVPSRGAALRRERQIKNMPRARKLALADPTHQRPTPKSRRPKAQGQTTPG